MPLLLALLALGPAAPVHAAVTLIVDGQPKARIYVYGPLDEQVPLAFTTSVHSLPDAQIRAMAVRELNEHLRKMSGAALEVVVTDDPTTIQDPAVVLGTLATQLGATPQKTTAANEGFRLIVRGQRVLIGGQSDRATLYGVYALLNQLGCDWLMPGPLGDVVPAAPTVTLNELDLNSAPAFFGRTIAYSDMPKEAPEAVAPNVQWLLRQRTGTRQFPGAGAAGHRWGGFIKQHQADFDSDPTMLALVRQPDGTLGRSGPQLETTHPRVIDLFVQDIKQAYRQRIEAGEWTKDTPASFGIGPADGLGYSLSSESLAAGSGQIDAMNGELDRTDEIVLMANRILAEVHKDYPKAQVGFYIYSVHGNFPQRYLPSPGLVAIFAPISYSRYHSVRDPLSKGQAYYRAIVEQWADLSRRQGNPLIFRGYNFNLAEVLVPYSKVRIWGEELPWYHERGFTGLTIEGAKAWSLHGPSDYVYMKLAWDPSLQWQDVLRDYCQKAYGEGAAPMERYFLSQIERQRTSGHEAGSFHAVHLIYDESWIAGSRELLGQARTRAREPEQKARIDLIEGGLRMLELYLEQHRATARFDYPTAQSIAETLLAESARQYEAHPELISTAGARYFKRFLSTALEEGARYSSAPYQLMIPLPDTLKTHFDPNLAGQRMGLFRPSIEDSNWLMTRTYSTTWDAQGLDRLRPGAVWYRWNFSLADAHRNQPLGLFLGSVDDTVQVWLNGQPIGRSPASFSRPSAFDLTAAVNANGNNLLTLQIEKTVPTNELGTGGLLAPSFLFTGPRLPTPAPLPPTIQLRFLPGGGS